MRAKVEELMCAWYSLRVQFVPGCIRKVLGWAWIIDFKLQNCFCAWQREGHTEWKAKNTRQERRGWQEGRLCLFWWAAVLVGVVHKGAAMQLINELSRTTPCYMETPFVYSIERPTQTPSAVAIPQWNCITTTLWDRSWVVGYISARQNSTQEQVREQPDDAKTRIT